MVLGRGLSGIEREGLCFECVVFGGFFLIFCLYRNFFSLRRFFLEF